MGKKGVIMDNGKQAQSSMALYWKKHHEQSKQPKKQYQKTEQQQLDERVQSGFQKWKLHKQKMISKTHQKKQKVSAHATEKNEEKNIQIQQEQQIYEKQPKVKAIVNIPGFKSKEGLKNKLRLEHVSQVDQSDNVLRLPSHLSGITQEQIIKILRSKKAQKQVSKRKNMEQKQEDVILGEDFLESFKKNPKEDQNENKIEPEVPQVVKEQAFFKSDILNQISKGDSSIIMTKKQQKEVKETKIQQVIQKQQKIQEQVHKIRPLFKPRVLTGNKR